MLEMRQEKGRALNTEPVTLESLYTRHATQVFRHAFFLLGSRDDAEDICQETFLRVFRAVDRFDPAGPALLSTWIFTIATRLCFDASRRERRRLAVVFDAPQGADRADAIAIGRALQRRVDRALLELPEHLRTAFALRVVGELSVKETAAALGVDEGTVKSRLARAREQLRTAIGEV